MLDLVKKILELVKSKVLLVELCVAFLVAIGVWKSWTLTISYSLLMVLIGWALVSIWYFWLRYWLKSKRRGRWVYFTFVLLASAGWVLSFRFHGLLIAQSIRDAQGDFKRGQYDNAEKQFNDAFSHTNDTKQQAECLCWLGEVYYVRGNNEAAKDSLTKCLQAATKGRWTIQVGHAHRVLGDMERKEGKRELAREHYARGIGALKGAVPMSREAQLELAKTLVHNGDFERIYGDLAEAFRSYQSADTLYKTVGYDLGEADALYGMGLLDGPQKPLSARSKLQRALAIYEKNDYQLGRANVASDLGDLELSGGEYSKAGVHFREALGLFQTIKEPLGEANSLLGLGDLARVTADYNSAQEHYKQAEALYKKDNCIVGLAGILRRLGDLNRTLGRQSEARDQFDKALTIVSPVQDREESADILRVLGDLERESCRFSLAREKYSESARLYGDLGNIRGQGTVELGLGHLERSQGHYEEAQRHYSLAQKKYEESEHRLGQANVSCAIGVLERQRDNHARALNLFQKALALYGDAKLGIANVWTEMGLLEIAMGDYDSAGKTCDDARGLYQAQKMWAGEAKALRCLAEVESRRGNPEPAGHFYEQALNKFLNPAGDDRRAADPEEYVELLLSRALHLTELGRTDEARPVIGTALELSTVNGLSPLTGRARRDLGRLTH